MSFFEKYDAMLAKIYKWFDDQAEHEDKLRKALYVNQEQIFEKPYDPEKIFDKYAKIKSDSKKDKDNMAKRTDKKNDLNSK